MFLYNEKIGKTTHSSHDQIINKHKSSIKPSNLEAMRTKSIKVNKE